MTDPVKPTNTDGFKAYLEGGYQGLTVNNGVEGDDSAGGLELGAGVGFQGSFKPDGRIKYSFEIGGSFNNAQSPIDSYTPAQSDGTVIDENGECHDIAGVGACDNPEQDNSAAVNGASLSEVNLNSFSIPVTAMVGYEFNPHFALFGGARIAPQFFTANATIPTDMVNAGGDTYGTFNGSQPVRSGHAFFNVGPHIEAQYRPVSNVAIALDGGMTFGSTEVMVSTAESDGQSYYRGSATHGFYAGAKLVFFPMGDKGDGNGGGIHISNPFKKKVSSEAPETSAARVASDYSGMTPQQELDAKASDLAGRYGITVQELYAKCHITAIAYTETNGFIATYDDASNNQLGTTPDQVIDNLITALANCEDCQTTETSAADSDKKTKAEKQADRDAKKAEREANGGFFQNLFGKKKVKSEESAATPETPVAIPETPIAAVVETTAAPTPATVVETPAPTTPTTSSLAGGTLDTTPVTVTVLTDEERAAAAPAPAPSAPEYTVETIWTDPKTKAQYEIRSYPDGLRKGVNLADPNDVRDVQAPAVQSVSFE